MKPKKQNGGPRKGAGRKPKYPGHDVLLYRRTIPKEWFKLVDNYLEHLRLKR